MVVQHNISAMNANRYFGINNSGLAKSLEKLSSGYAINRAGDNAAGLAVSEKMRSQIAGLTQGVKNAQDGISMVQTYEGALTETDSILQRMKTLANQAANGTYQDEVDRDAIQLEFDQLNDELNQIADTDFNGVVVLNGGRMADGTVANNTTTLSKMPTVNFKKNGNNDAAIVYSENVNGSVDANGNGSVSINGVRVELKGGWAVNNAGGTGSYKPDASSSTIVSDASEYKLTSQLKYDAKTGFSGGKMTATEFYQVAKGDNTVTINGETFNVNWSTGVITHADGSNQNLTTDKDGFDAAIKMNTSSGLITVVTKYNVAADGTITNEKNGKTVGSMDMKNGVSTSDSVNHGTINMTYASSITMQVGARGKDSVNFNFAYTSNGIGNLKSDLDCSSRGLGTNQLSLTTQEKANFAIDKIDNAINKVSMVRATFGSIQNRLEHKIDNMNVTKENMTSSESRIRDTNMAEEMTNFTKNQILSQASQAMLAQANQLPQGVLQLLG